MVAPTDIKYDFEPANPDPGDDYDKFRERALNAMSTSDDRGWSLSDHMLGIDEGGPGGPPMPGGAGLAKAQQAFRGRQKNAYKLLSKHVLDPGHLTDLYGELRKFDFDQECMRQGVAPDGQKPRTLVPFVAPPVAATARTNEDK